MPAGRRYIAIGACAPGLTGSSLPRLLVTVLYALRDAAVGGVVAWWPR